MADDYIAVGIVGKPYGVQGEVRVYSLSDVPDRFQALKTVWWLHERQPKKYLKLIRARYLGTTWVIHFEGYNTPEEVSVLTGGKIAVLRSERGSLPPGQYFIDDIVGLRVVDESGTLIGHIQDVLQTGANDIYVVESKQGELLLPALQGVVLEIDLTLRRMRVHIPEGLQE